MKSNACTRYCQRVAIRTYHFPDPTKISLAVLKSAGLVKDQAAGTRRIYEIDPKGLGTIRAWLDQFWDAALASFKDEAEGTRGNR